MTKDIKRRSAAMAPAAQARSDVAGADHDRSSIFSTQRQSLGITMKRALLHRVSAIERLRIWLLERAWFHSRLLPALPRRLRWMVRRIHFAPVDVADRLLGRQDPGLPPKALMFTGASMDFAASGRRPLETICSITGANPSSYILEVGCGIGRLATAMPAFLDADGRYEGLDTVPEGIEWCEEHIVGPHDNINFTLADVYNKEHNPKGRKQAADYQFPYEGEAFDVAILISVFTHMLPTDVDRYVGEIARVLRPSGRICASWSSINPESLGLMRSGGGSVHLRCNLGTHGSPARRYPSLASLMTSVTSAEFTRSMDCPTRRTSTMGGGAAELRDSRSRTSWSQRSYELHL
jgi:SAM-dependent methyltransferase